MFFSLRDRDTSPPSLTILVQSNPSHLALSPEVVTLIAQILELSVLFHAQLLLAAEHGYSEAKQPIVRNQFKAPVYL